MKILNVLKWTGIGIAGVGFIALVIYGVMLLWNWLVPALFNGPIVTYWQTAGLLLLSKILFAGFSPGCHHDDDRAKARWKRKYSKKFHTETPSSEAQA